MMTEFIVRHTLCLIVIFLIAKLTVEMVIRLFDSCPFPSLQKKLDRYPMCKDQPAQIDCRKDWCLFWRKGSCKNISPAITLNQDGTYRCWSYEEK